MSKRRRVWANDLENDRRKEGMAPRAHERLTRGPSESKMRNRKPRALLTKKRALRRSSCIQHTSKWQLGAAAAWIAPLLLIHDEQRPEG